MTSTSNTGPVAAPFPLGSTTKHDVVARTAPDGQVVVLGSVFSPAAAAKLADDATQAGLVDVQTALHYSRAEFDAARRASARPAGEGT
jgi:hypothetical protein